MKQAKLLTKLEMKRVLALVAVGKHAERNRMILMLGFLAGLRACSIAALKIGDVLDSEGKIRDEFVLDASQTKGNKSQRVFLSQKMRKEIALYIASLTHVFPHLPLIYSQKSKRHFSGNSLVQLVNRIFKSAGIHSSSHAMRRQFITNLANNAVNPRVIQKLVNHSSLNHTMRYIEVTDTQMKTAVDLI